MGYEPCKGDCYAYDDVLPLDELNEADKAEIQVKLLQMHNPMCGNAAMRYGVDLDENRQVYIGFFYHFGAIETMSDVTLKGIVNQILDCALAHFATEQYREEIRQHPGLGRDACAYGTDAALMDFVRRSARSMAQAKVAG
jgi:hypothetical protein